MAQPIGAYLSNSGAGQLVSAVVEELIDRKDQITQGRSSTAWSETDPLGFNTLSYPSDITNNMENGHYMLFYVNVQNKTKYRYKDPQGVDVGVKYEVETNTYKATESVILVVVGY